MKLLKQEWNVFWARLLVRPIFWLNCHPDKWWSTHAANLLTGFRGLIMTPLVVGLALADPSQRGPWLFAIFVVQLTDGADGAIARGTGTESDLGSTLDGTVDKYSAVLLTGGLITWIRPEFGQAKTGVYIFFLAIIISAEYMSIRANKDRMDLFHTLGKKFSSRLPAQIKFSASMLILGSCWLASDRAVAAQIFSYGVPVIMLLTIWSAWDYTTDRDELEQEFQQEFSGN
jgi:phosphatidylglycerophosphate synthase